VTDPYRREVYFEFVAIGNVVKVTAIDSQTGIEVSASEAENSESATVFAEDSVMDIGLSRGGLAYHIGRNPPRLGWWPRTAAIC